jgi:putative spermidine/putrescine transport system substrate-binding protein
MRARGTKVLAAALFAVALVASACGGSGGGGTTGGGGGGPTTGGGTQAAQPPTAGMTPQSTIGAGEGQLNLIAWSGYVDDAWKKPFEQQTGCKVNAKYAGSSDQMVSLMANGGGGQYDMVSASGDADLRLIYGGDVKPVNVNLIPDWKNFFPAFQSPPFNTINGVHYGVSLQWGPNILMYNSSKITTPPTSWSDIYSPQYSGQVTVPNNPIQIADAALYLEKTKPSLGITDPYELTQAQFQAAVDLLKQQRPYIKKYWADASDEISMFKNGDAVIGAAWPYQESQLKDAKFPVASVIPKEGATGWADSWLLATKAPHPNCAYLWMKYISEPHTQALQAVTYGETPDNKLACPIMDQLSAGACATYHADAPIAYFQSISLWKTPLADCGNGKSDCVPYSQWVQAWSTEVTG